MVIAILFVTFLLVLGGCGNKPLSNTNDDAVVTNTAGQTVANTSNEAVQNTNVVVGTNNVPESKDYGIDFTASYLGEKKFIAEGTTDLPVGAKIKIKIHDEDYYKHDDDDMDWRLENLTFITDTIVIDSQTFSATLVGTDLSAPLKSENYTIEISFNPRAQSDKIKEIVGENGEYLEGSLIDNSISGLAMLETTTTIALN